MNNRFTLLQLNKILKKVRAFEKEFDALSDEEIASKTDEFRKRLDKGETTDDILPEAYAVVCQADRRILGKRPYDVQVLGAIAMHKGYLCEMNTGEGKTLVATLPMYLNGLTGKSAILVTTNEYLALRDAEEMGNVYNFLGLTVAAGVNKDASKRFTNEEKKEIYSKDIVYTTHAVLGFDYLFNNLCKDSSEKFLREFNYVIIDEADSVLLDSAQTPLVISGSPKVQSNLYELADFFVTTLEQDVHFEKEEKKVWLTEEGIKRAEEFFEIDNFYSEENFEVNRHVTLALRAHALFEIERDYVINRDGELVLLDNESGRMMPGVKMRGGQHQAIEQKELIEVTQENRSVASITYQNLFLMFPHMAGMSGTIRDAAEEVFDIYHKKVVVIPTNHPIIRKDQKDVFFADFESQFNAAIKEAIKHHKTKQPVLIVASTIAETEYLSRLLINERIPHNVLNANNAFWEAEIIKEAGNLGAVTVATSMAGRGTDIKLSDEVKALGGLAVIGVGRMTNIRQERQARGRAGRQGDPGFSIFFVSLEDDVVANFDNEKLEPYIEGKKHISTRKIKRYVNKSQKITEERARDSRKKALDYDLVMKLQRNLLYNTRNDLLFGANLTFNDIIEIAKENIEDFLNGSEELTSSSLTRYILDNISYTIDYRVSDMLDRLDDKDFIQNGLIDIVRDGLKLQESRIGYRDDMSKFMRIATLRAIDDAWVEEVDYLQQLQSAVSGRATAQRNLVFEYQRDALLAFRLMEREIKRNIVRNILLSDVTIDEEEELHIMYP
ncbi:MAG: accessory Sec system translocase SecA2 [Lachnospiraceae bacterium]|nr:accessory Sec system translocase SecA2 [Lachnospiraceae bacterium]